MVIGELARLRLLPDAPGEKGFAGAELAPPAQPWGTPRSTVLSGNAAEQLRHFTGWVYAAIRPIAQRIASQPISIARVTKPMRRTKGMTKAMRDGLKPLDSHPFLDLIHDPNDSMGWGSLAYAWVASILLSGEGFLLFDVNDERDELWPIPTSWATPIHGERPYIGWRIRPNNHAQDLLVPGELMARAALPNPADPFEAAGPLQAAAGAVTADEAIQASQVDAFANGIHPTHAVKVGKLKNNEHRMTLDDAQRQQIITSIKRRYSGMMKRHEPVIIDSLIEGFEKLSNSPEEMDYLNSSEMTKSRILQAFGVSPIIAGQVESNSRAASAEADRHFCNNVVNPLITLLSETLTGWAGPLYAEEGERLEIWIEPAVPRDEESLRENVATLLRFGVITQNEARELLLGLPPIKGGDVPLVPMNLAPGDFDNGE